MTATIVLSNPQINTNYITRDGFLTRSGKGENNKSLQNTETKKKLFFFPFKNLKCYFPIDFFKLGCSLR